MNKKLLVFSSMVVFVALLFTYQTASAHTTVHVGSYDVEIGWVNEPPIVGERNYVVVNVANTTSATAKVDISKLTVDVTYGGQSKTLTLQPLSEDTTNQYIAPLFPTVPGQYTVQLRGLLDTQTISQDVTPEEVVPAETLMFPSTGSTQTPQNNGFGWSGWLSIISVIVGLAALGLAIMAFRKVH